MKYLNTITLLTFLLGFSMISCQNSTTKSDEKEAETGKLEEETAVVSFDTENVLITWTAFKTTEKKPVKGEFKAVTITNFKESSNKVEALNGVEFEIPISSIFSNNDDRDSKLKTLFFEVMDNTASLGGTLNLQEKGTGTVKLTMNGVEAEFPITYENDEYAVSISGTLNLDNWNAQGAVESLNKACFDLHKGADGVSKTWSEVEVNATIQVK
jgi:hypothetical protein